MTLLPPSPPLGRIIGESDTEFCDKCGSGLVRKFFIGPICGCRQPECSNFYQQRKHE